MKTYTLDEVQDKLIGKVGTPNRDRFEYELQMDNRESNKTDTSSPISPVAFADMCFGLHDFDKIIINCKACQGSNSCDTG
ncbi:MAG: hypothetical protein WCP32_13210 [Bacteroidota bacterium]